MSYSEIPEKDRERIGEQEHLDQDTDGQWWYYKQSAIPNPVAESLIIGRYQLEQERALASETEGNITHLEQTIISLKTQLEQYQKAMKETKATYEIKETGGVVISKKTWELLSQLAEGK